MRGGDIGPILLPAAAGRSSPPFSAVGDHCPTSRLGHPGPPQRHYPPTLPSAATTTSSSSQPTAHLNINHPLIITAQPSHVHPANTGRLPYSRCRAPRTFSRSPQRPEEDHRRKQAAPKGRPAAWTEADSVVRKINTYSDEPHRSRHQTEVAASPSSLGAHVSPPPKITPAAARVA